VLRGTLQLRVGIGPEPSISASREISRTLWQRPVWFQSQKEKAELMASATKNEVPRCPYCVSGAVFREMKVLENGRRICEKCGHIVFPDDRAFWCPCPKCLESRLSPTLRKIKSAKP
jgi:uncharacterized protein (DUF983 family)